jgi:tetratricopeptide (TPR) repeat protein
VRRGSLEIARDAFDSFQAAARLRPKDPAPLVEAGLLALDMGDGATATRMLARVDEAAPGSDAVRFLKGCIHKARGNHLDARDEFLAASKGEFRREQAGDLYYECTLGYALDLGNAGRLEPAMKLLREAVAQRPDHPLLSIAYYNMGAYHRRLESTALAEEVLLEGIRRFPSYAPSYGELGDLYTTLERYDEAVAVLDRAVRADATYARGWLLKADAEIARGRLPQAEEALAEYDRRFAETGDSAYTRGLLLVKKGEPKAAAASFQRALALDPGRIRALYHLSLCHRDLGEEEKARESMDRWKKAEAEMKARHARDLRQARAKAGVPLSGAAEDPEEAPPGGDRDREVPERVKEEPPR